MKKKLIVLGLTAALVCALSACAAKDSGEAVVRLPNLIFSINGTEPSENTNPDWVENRSQDSEPSQSVDVHLFIDGSESMRGYLTYSGSNYDRMISSLPSVCVNAFEAYDLKAYKVFDDVYLMKDAAHEFTSIGDDYVDYIYQPAFYGSELGVRSGEVRAADKTRADYGKVIQTIEEINPDISTGGGAANDLYILVSDFIPQDSQDMDFYRFTAKLYSEILSQNLCCGIAGFKSAFSGEIACLSQQNKKTSFEYEGEMPFYIIVIGETQNVTKFMSEIQERIDHFEMASDEYGIFITDGQRPYNDGSGDTFEVAWQDMPAEGLVSTQSIDTMVSYELLKSDAYQQNDILTHTAVYNIYPPETYGDSGTLQGTLCYKLPYKLSSASSIDIKNQNWTLTYDAEVICGDMAVNVAAIDEIRDKCEGHVDFPEDMSVTAFEYIYGQGTPQIESWEDPYEAMERVWTERCDTYMASMSPLTVDTENMFVTLGEGYVKDGEILIPVTINASKMKSEMPYLISMNIAAAPKIGTKSLADWISGWDVDNSKLNSWISAKGGSTEGQTPGLARALKALQGDRIYDDGVFVRQVNLILAKGEVLAPQDAVVWAKKQEVDDEATAVSVQDETENSKFDWIFDIFKKGEGK